MPQNEASVNNKYGEDDITTGVIATSRSDPSASLCPDLEQRNVKQMLKKT